MPPHSCVVKLECELGLSCGFVYRFIRSKNVNSFLPVTRFRRFKARCHRWHARHSVPRFASLSTAHSHSEFKVLWKFEHLGRPPIVLNSNQAFSFFRRRPVCATHRFFDLVVLFVPVCSHTDMHISVSNRSIREFACTCKQTLRDSVCV